MKKVPHRPFVFLVLAYGLGIASQNIFSVTISLLLAISILTLIASFVFFNRRKMASIGILLIFFCLGAIQFSLAHVRADDDIAHEYRFYRKTSILIKGVVVSDVRTIPFFRSTKTSFILQIFQVKAPWGWKQCSGRVLVNIFNDNSVNYGDKLFLEGKIHYPFEFSQGGKFSYRKYLKRQGVDLILSIGKDGSVEIVSEGQANVLKAMSLKVRNHLRDQFFVFLTDNEASIMKAMILGDRTALPRNIKMLFERTGTIHVLAISGLHVGIIAGLCLLLLNLIPVRREWRYLCACVLLVGYCFLTGGRPSAIRATIMIIVVLMSYVVEKESDIFNTMSLAALLILLFNPLFIFGIEFQ